MKLSFEELRENMVSSQIEARGIKNKKILEVMRKIPRHLFVPKDIQISAYEDCALPIGEAQTISQPYMVAIMTELLDPEENDKILEIGTGSGYQTAILAELAKEVVSIERVEDLSKKAEAFLRSQGYLNITVIVGDGSQGYALKAPYDKILITAACPDIPAPLIDQLTDGGKIVLPIGDRFLQTLTVAVKNGEQLETERSIGCVFVPLLGKYGFS
jgi:protein-L-isoaspartate(D-aspartate) O-methyltransferase